MVLMLTDSSERMTLNHPTEREKCNYDCRVDRFTELPDVVIHHIFSFLDMKDMFRICIMSKRCLELCFSSPYINFVDRHPRQSYGYGYHRNCDKSRCKSFKSSLGQYRAKHRKNDIVSFSLQWIREKCDCYADGRSLLRAWLHRLAKCKLQELSLDINPTEGSTSQKSLRISNSCSKFLRVLEIDLGYDKIRLPSKVLSCLEILSLNSSSFEDSRCSVGEWISTCCPSLKKLSLVSVPEKLDLENHSMTDVTISTTWFSDIRISGNDLQTLSLYFPTEIRSYIHGRGYVKDKTSVEVSAPNLQVLKWDGCVPDELNISEPLWLTEATLNTCRTDEPCKETLEPFAHLLQCAWYAKVLRVNISLIEAMFINYGGMREFVNLQQLEIMNCVGQTYECYHTPLMEYFLLSTPKLMSLTVDCNEKHHSIQYRVQKTRDLMTPIINEMYQGKEEDGNPLDKNEEDGNSLANNEENGKPLDRNEENGNPLDGNEENGNPLDGNEECGNQLQVGPPPQLKEVKVRLSKVEGSNESSNGMCLVKFFLWALFSLEEMTILYPPSLFYELPTFCTEELELASSQVTVLTMMEHHQIDYSCED